MRIDLRPCAGTASVCGVGVLSSTVCELPSAEPTDNCTARNAGTDTTGGLSLPPARITYDAGTRTLVEPPVDFEPPREDPDPDGALVLDEPVWVGDPDPEPEPDPDPAPPLALVEVAVAVVLEVIVAVVDVLVLALADAAEDE